MNSKRAYYVLLGAVGLLAVGILAGAFEVNNLLVAKSKHLVSLKTQSQVVTSQQQGLVRAKKQVQQYADLETIAKSIVPQDKDQAEAVREIANIASASGIPQLTSVTFPASTLGTTITGVGGATVPTGGSSKLTQLLPVKGISGVYTEQITIQQSNDHAIPYYQFLTFLQKLEQNRRTAQVASIALQPDSKNPNNVAFTLIINEFIKP
jgi:hypothetical protein